MLDLWLEGCRFKSRIGRSISLFFAPCVVPVLGKRLKNEALNWCRKLMEVIHSASVWVWQIADEKVSFLLYVQLQLVAIKCNNLNDRSSKARMGINVTWFTQFVDNSTVQYNRRRFTMWFTMSWPFATFVVKTFCSSPSDSWNQTVVTQITKRTYTYLVLAEKRLWSKRSTNNSLTHAPHASG